MLLLLGDTWENGQQRVLRTIRTRPSMADPQVATCGYQPHPRPGKQHEAPHKPLVRPTFGLQFWLYPQLGPGQPLIDDAKKNSNLVGAGLDSRI